MEQNINNKIKFKDRFIKLYNTNKLKVWTTFSILTSVIIFTLFFQINQKKENQLIAEKYIEADLYLSSNNKIKSKKLFEEIIYSKNNFYSILALNSILDNNFSIESNEILKYFKILEELKNSQEQKDLLIFKKALFLIKNSRKAQGEKLLKRLIDENSTLKNLAEEIIIK